MYKLIYDLLSQKVGGIVKGNLFIPMNEDNKDYQEYLEWLADGGVPEPADTPEEAE
jgi:hypothetical protein